MVAGRGERVSVGYEVQCILQKVKNTQESVEKKKHRTGINIYTGVVTAFKMFYLE